MPKIRIPDAEAEVQEVRESTCLTCDTILAPEEIKYCPACKMYWEDINLEKEYP